MHFLALNIAFFEGFENDNILSSKSYTVTKSGIVPQRKLRSYLIHAHKIRVKYQNIFVKLRACSRAYEP